MKHSNILGGSLIILITTVFCYSAIIVIEPTRLTKYHESIRIGSNGEAESHITLQLSDNVSELYLPLIISDEIALLKNSEKCQVSVSGKSNSRYLVVKSIDSSPLEKYLELDISYVDLVKNDKFWNIIDKPCVLFDYSEHNNYYSTIGEYSATISLPTNAKFDLPDNVSDKNINNLVSIEYHKSDAMKEVSLKASNISFDDINLLVILRKSSSSLAPYIMIIVALIAVYVVFLRFIFKS